ncbi:MAG: serine hydrolase domain-containing protein, partial [Vicinamibacteraceae bacterium]
MTILIVRARVLSICFALVAAAVLAAAPAHGQSLAPASPESVGVSSERLARLSDTMRRYVEQKKVAGVVTLIAREGKVINFDAFGHRDIEANAPMEKD